MLLSEGRYDYRSKGHTWKKKRERERHEERERDSNRGKRIEWGREREGDRVR